MIYVTGDCHARFKRFSTKNFPEQKDMTREDYVIVCGDFGIWHDTPEERWWLDWLEQKRFTILFVDGNHENFDRLYSKEFPRVNFHDGKAHRIRENLYHLMRGYVFDLEGKKFFAFGGAQSHDIDDGILDRCNFNSDHEFNQTVRVYNMFGMRYRINHVSWWKQELPTKRELDRGIRNLSKVHNEVDFIISHCCPQEIASANGFFGADKLTNYFDEIAERTKFDRWYFGHYHDNRVTYSKFVMLYDRMERIV